MLLHNPVGVVTPTLEGPVVAVLARADAAFTGRQVHRLVGRASEPGVRKALERLVEQGLVIKGRVGPSYTYRLNRDHLAAPHVSALADLREELFGRWRDQLGGWIPPPTVAVLYGSAAHGDMRPDSDIDLLLVTPSGHADVESDLAQLERDTARWTGNDTRVLHVTEDDVGDHDPVMVDAATHGIVVFGDATWFRRAALGSRSGHGA